MRQLRQLINDKFKNDWYHQHIIDINFELNHLELHDLDGYLLSMYEKKIVSASNANNSNVAYLIGVTTQEPNGRIKTVGGSFPDIDSDFMHSRRDEIFSYLHRKYGEGFAHIGIFGVAKAKGILKDVMRIFDVPFEKSNTISKMIPDMTESLAQALEESVDFKKLVDSDPDIAEMVEYASQLEGCIKSVGIHACGTILSPEPLQNHIPLFESKGVPVTQFDGPTMEQLGFIKVDVLGIKCLSVIGEAIKLVNSRYDQNIVMEEIPLDDGITYDLFADGNLLGVFQVEGDALTAFTQQCRPKTLDDIAAIISLYRPGPMNMPGYLDSYIARSNGHESSVFILPRYDHIFKDTYGLLTYQEQGMRLLREMCGFNDIEADDWRKAVGKKDMKKLQSMETKFIDGAVKNGEDPKLVKKLWDDMLEFGRYAFNKSHAVAYGHLTYYTAWLKANYPAEFYAACITCEEDPVQKAVYVEDARRNGISVCPPDINQSGEGFAIADNGSIVFGFNGIKGLGPAVINKLLSLRPFTSLGDFLIKSYYAKGINKKHLEVLINCGALDNFGFKRSCMARSFEKYILDFDPKGAKEHTPEQIKAHIGKQSEYFVDPDLVEYPLLTILQWEKQLLGIHVSGDPFSVVKKVVRDEYKPAATYANAAQNVGQFSGYLLVQINAVKAIQTKAGKKMAFVDCIDHTGEPVSLTVFPNVYPGVQESLVAGTYALAFVNVKSEPRGISYLLNSVRSLTAEIDKVSDKIAAEKDVKKLNICLTSVPGVVRLRTLMKKIEPYITTDKTHYSVSICVDIGGAMYTFVTLPVKKIDVNVMREFNRIADAYVIRGT